MKMLPIQTTKLWKKSDFAQFAAIVNPCPGQISFNTKRVYGKNHSCLILHLGACSRCKVLILQTLLPDLWLSGV